MAKEKPEITVTFIIDCPKCKARVAATETGNAKQVGFVGDPEDYQEVCGQRIHIGNCPICNSVLVGASEQIDFAGQSAVFDRWSDIVRVYPKPPKSFSSQRIPKVVRDSLLEADRALQVNANTAACAMLGRAMEGIFRHMLQVHGAPADKSAKKQVMLNQGIVELEKKGYSAESVGQNRGQKCAKKGFSRHGSGVQWGGSRGPR